MFSCIVTFQLQGALLRVILKQSMSMDDETSVRFEAGFTLQEALEMAYIDDIEEIFIEPPDPNSLTDEDSADEDSGGELDNLSGRQLRSKVEIRLTNSTERLTCENQEVEDPLDTIAIDDENPHISTEEMRTFIAILILSGYDTKPSKRHLWDSGLDLRIIMVSDSMRRDRFAEIMRFVHLADNNNIDTTDKMYKL
ncbi:hypothetical protein JTB14_024668 [Gonioctena quinquepunctata]|nr:hypothetical protein JTB14_024668 [Gonioctena quinquepunctata]